MTFNTIGLYEEQGSSSAMLCSYDDGVTSVVTLNEDLYVNGFGGCTRQMASISLTAGAIAYQWDNTAKTITASSGTPFSALNGTVVQIYDTLAAGVRGTDVVRFTYVDASGKRVGVTTTVSDSTATVMTLHPSVDLGANRVVEGIEVLGSATGAASRVVVSAITLCSISHDINVMIKDFSGTTLLDVGFAAAQEPTTINLGPVGILSKSGLKIGYNDKSGALTTHDMTVCVSYKVI